LDAMDTLQQYPGILEKMGSVERYLARRGLYIRSPVTPQVLRDLQYVGGLTAYQDNGIAFNEVLHYFFIREDGNSGPTGVVLVPPLVEGVVIPPPPFKFPFPIPAEETAFVGSKPGAGH
jgi:hypothetical protein